jgi:hypothetical protein
VFDRFNRLLWIAAVSLLILGLSPAALTSPLLSADVRRVWFSVPDRIVVKSVVEQTLDMQAAFSGNSFEATPSSHRFRRGTRLAGGLQLVAPTTAGLTPKPLLLASSRRPVQAGKVAASLTALNYDRPHLFGNWHYGMATNTPGASGPVVDESFQFPGAGRSGGGVKNFEGPPNAVVRGASPGRVFVTDGEGRVILDITADRVKPVVPGQGFVAGDGRKLVPTAEQLDWIKKLWG